MSEKDLECKIIEVIELLEKEINSRSKRTGVYKKILKNYQESLDECRKGNLNKVVIRGSVKFFYDSLADYNEELVKKMAEAEELIAKIKRG
jgi:hypothetical protein